MERINMDISEPILVIMAGGHGERLWPCSRRNHPKQLLKLIDQQSLLQRSFDLVAGLTDQKRIFISTNAAYRSAVKNQMPFLNSKNILTEPESRNTAPGVGLAASYISAYFPEEDPVIGFIPCDQYVQNPTEMRRVIRTGFEFAKKTTTGVVYGMIPTRMETGFGYILPGEILHAQDDLNFFKVNLFKEKPDQKTLEELNINRNLLWNNGIILWKLSGLMAEIAGHLPLIATGLQKFKPFIGTPEETERLHEIYASFPAISIDYGVLEKSNNLAVVPSQYQWDDLGNWDTIGRLLPKDPAGNTSRSEYLSLDTKNCLFYSPQKLVASLGVSDLVVIETDDVLMICAKERVQDVKLLVKKLTESNRMDLT